MSVRVTISALALAFCLSASPVCAQTPAPTDHLSYYTYYKTRAGESVSTVAAKFGLAELSLRRMNPQLTDSDDVLPKGSTLCVPKAKPEPPEPKSFSTASVEKSVKKSSKKKSRKKKRRRKKEREEPSKAEWERLAELATEDAPDVSREILRAKPAAPPSKMIGSDGRVVWIPAAAPKPVPKPKKKKRSRKRTKLYSRKGKAIHGVLKTCRSYIGTPYVWGGELPGGFDCSGYVQYVFAKHGYRLPRTADIQFNVGKRVKRGKEKPGDLVFFETYAPGASHVGVYLGRGYFIHASSSRGVTVERLATDFFAQRYLGAKRQSF